MSTLSKAISAGTLILSSAIVPTTANALTMSEFREATVLFLYGGIGFFGGVALLYFFGGFIVYLVRLGQEFRQDGLYYMLHGVRILFYILIAVGILLVLE